MKKYTLTEFFNEFPAIKINKVAERAGINRTLMMNYLSGEKNPSDNMLQKIEKVVHELAAELKNVTIHKPKK